LNKESRRAKRKLSALSGNVIIAQTRATKNLFALLAVIDSPQENNVKEMAEVSELLSEKQRIRLCAQCAENFASFALKKFL
jgi:hypothetical protein